MEGLAGSAEGALALGRLKGIRRRQRFKESQNRFTGQSVSMRNSELYDAIYVSGDKRSEWKTGMVIGSRSIYRTTAVPLRTFVPFPRSYSLDDGGAPPFRDFLRVGRAVLRATRSSAG